MKEYTFIAWCSCGTEETEVGVELTNAEAKLLEKYGKQSEYYWDGFENCEPLADIYQKVYEIAVDQITAEVAEAGDDDHAEDDEWRADDTYTCGVDFPREFEEELEDSEEAD